MLSPTNDKPQVVEDKKTTPLTYLAVYAHDKSNKEEGITGAYVCVLWFVRWRFARQRNNNNGGARISCLLFLCLIQRGHISLIHILPGIMFPSGI